MLIRDFISIQDRVDKDDFVLKLTDGISKPEATLGNYVVTKDLVQNFADALTFIKGAFDPPRSRGTYLHGSFGSGKSHFMAVLNLLLQGNHDARSLPKLDKVITENDAWLKDKRFLMVPYHMIGATTIEEKIFEGYVDWVAEHHPGAPVPPLFRSAAILENAASLRSTMGDDLFFEKLNESKSGGSDDGWGELSGGWSAENYEEAAGDPTSNEHGDLISDVIEHLLPSVQQEGEYLDLDKGLVALSRHAKGLGYDGVILFLDELILWLASRSGDMNFLNQEVNKLVKLVEAQGMNRVIPIISFIARQRDLRELVGDKVAGAANMNFIDHLDHFENRFETIQMGDNNLPEIAAERLLKPINAEAKAKIDESFESTASIRQEVREILMTENSDKEAFRNLYPFSPALVETLVAVSSLLQRERTALRILLQLLVDNRDSMQLGELFPVGDLYDQIAKGDDAFSSDMKRHFQTADKLYRQHFQPMLEETHDLSFEAAKELPQDDPTRIALRNDDRLVKTILLSALAPDVKTLKALTPARLAALNHGTIKTRIKGQEASIVLAKLEEWSGRVGQLKVDESIPPLISLQLSEVDADSILEKAASQDNPGNRLRCLKDILYKNLGLQDDGRLWLEHNYRWRGTDRRCKVLFKNVWEADLDLFESDDDHWKLVIDYPLDSDDSKGPTADLARLNEYRDERDSTNTIVWLPSFLSPQALKDLGKLVKLETILAEHAFAGYVTDLSMQDRATAKSILINQRDALRSRMVTYLQTAYGLREDRSGVIDSMRKLDGVDHFQSLSSGLQLNVPGESHLNTAMEGLLHQAMASQHPQHPDFNEETKLTPTYVQKVLDVFHAALQQTEGRVEVEKNQRDNIRMIANPLKLGEMAPQYFVPGEHWKDHFRRKAPDGLDGVTVAEMREWIEWGIPPLLEDLIIIACAAQLNCSFSLHGSPFQPKLKDLPDSCKLKTQVLPSPENWDRANEVQASILGRADLPKLLSAQGLDDFSVKVREEASRYDQSVGKLISQLESEAGRHGLSDFDRLSAARDAQRFLGIIKAKYGCDLVTALATFTSDQPDKAISTSIEGTESVLHVLPIDRQTLDTALSLDSPLKEEAEKLEADLINGLKRNEYVAALAEVVKDVNHRAWQLVKRKLEVIPPPVSPPNPDDVSVAVVPPVSPEVSQPDATALKRRYRKSQVQGDALPEWMSDSLAERVLEVIPVAGGSKMIVITPTLRAILNACEDAEIDLEAGTLKIPSQGVSLNITTQSQEG